MFGSFIWSAKHPRIGLRTLQEPWGQGGLALPDLFKYFIAGQMVVARRWLLRDDGDAANVLEAAYRGSFESLSFLLYRGTSAMSSPTDSMGVTIRAWDRAKVLMKSQSDVWSPDTPLWFNPKLLHLNTIPDPIIWARVGIKELTHKVGGKKLLTFNQLKDRHKLPNWYFFRYLQLSHTFKSQFGSDSLDIGTSPIESLLSEENLKKPLSEVYKGLFVETPKMHNKCRDTWSALIPDFGRDDWDDMWDRTFGILVSTRDRLIQFKLLHRIYYTLAKLAGIYGTGTGECWRCACSPADFDHIFWHCQEIRKF